MSDHAFLSRSYDQVSPSGTPVSPPNRITRSDSASYAMAWRHRPGGPGSCGFAFVHSFVSVSYAHVSLGRSTNPPMKVKPPNRTILSDCASYNSAWPDRGDGPVGRGGVRP